MTPREATELSSPVSRRFVRLAWTIGVGVPVSLAPLLGAKVVPFFAPLLSVLSSDLKGIVVPFSIFMVSLVAVTLEFYVGERISGRSLRWIFPLGAVLLLAAISWLLVLQTSYVIRLPAEKGRVLGVAKTSQRMPGCPCDQPPRRGDLACVRFLTVDPAQLEQCWDGPELVSVRLRLAASYLLAMFLLTSLIGVVVLRAMTRRRRRPAGGPRSPPRSPRQRPGSAGT